MTTEKCGNGFVPESPVKKSPGSLSASCCARQENLFASTSAVHSTGHDAHAVEMAEGEASAAKSQQLTNSSFRKSLYALEQWPSAIDSLRNQNQSPEFVNMFCGLIDRTLSELEVISSLLDKQSKRQGPQGGDKAKDKAPSPGTSTTKGDDAQDGGKPAEGVKRPSSEAAPQPGLQLDAPTPPVVKKARMKYTPLRKPSV